MKGYFNRALCHFYAEPIEKSEHSDESFYGQSFELLEDLGEFCLINSEYNYKGYCKKEELFFGEYNTTHVITSGFGDLLIEPKNCYLAAYCLPRGSKIKVLEEGGTDRYAAVEAMDGKTYYIHRMNIMPIEEQERKRSEEEFRKSVIATAKLFEGSGYRWGGKTVGGIDCSGLAFMSYYMNGVVIHRDANVKLSPCLRTISLEEAKAGDLLFFPGHVAIYIGEGLYIHSTTSLGGVGYNSFNPYSPIYRPQLMESLETVATIF